MAAAVKSGGNVRVRVFRDLDELSLAAADRIVEILRDHQQTGNRVSVALSGGMTPRQCYSLIGAVERRSSIDWNALHIFWTDERCVPAHDEASNYKMAYELLLSKVAVPGQNVHRVRGEDPPDKAATEYESTIATFFGNTLPRFELVILGAGADGHTASLFPGSAAIQERTRLAVPVLKRVPEKNRITLTLPVLNNAAHVLFLASGPQKASVVREIFENGNARGFPAGLVQPVSGSLEWFIDRSAASGSRSLSGG